MPTYTVHAPPPKAGETTSDPQRFVFVRDGFHFWAFLLAPIWLLYRRLWLAFVLYLVLSAAVQAAFWLLGMPGGARTAIGLLIGLLIGLEASTIRRWTYARRKWKTIGVVTGDDGEEAERRFFAEWVTRPDDLPQPVASAPPPPLARRDPVASGEIIGLFPQPERRS
jgi:hypothetical protein